MQKLFYWSAPMYTVVIVIASLIDNPVPSVSISNVDKVYHAIAYMIMALLWYVFFYTRYLSKQNLTSISIKTILKNWSRTIAIGASVFSLLVGVFIEFGQEYIALNRTMDFMDVLANLTGIIIAMFVLLIIDKSFNKHKVT